MAELCYKCSQRKAVVDSKVVSTYGSYQHPESKGYESYLYQHTPLCNKCTSVLLGNGARVHSSRDVSRDMTSQRKRGRGGGCSVKLVLTLVAVFVSVNCFGFLAFVLYSEGPSVSMTTLIQKAALSISTLNDQVHTLLHSLSTLDILVLVKLPSTWTFPSTTDDRLYLVALIIQVTTLALRQHDKLSISLSLTSYIIYQSEDAILGVIPTSERSYIASLRYALLLLSALRVLTKKSTVVTVSKRKSGQRPVIKVRRSPKKRDSPSAGTLFSDDENTHTPGDHGNHGNRSPTPLDLSANERAVLMSRDEALANKKTCDEILTNDCRISQSTPIPLTDVRSRFDVMKISGSPIKAATPPHQTKGRSSGRNHSSCIRPAKFSLGDRSVDSNKSQPPPEAPVERSAERPRFDSTETEEVAAGNLAEQPSEQHNKVANDALQLKPIIVVLILSIVTNFYLVVSYVLSPETVR